MGIMNQSMKQCPAANNLLINSFFPSHPLGLELIPGTFCFASAPSAAPASHPSLPRHFWPQPVVSEAADCLPPLLKSSTSP